MKLTSSLLTSQNLRIIAPVAILIIAIVVSRELMSTAPKANRQSPAQLARLVEIVPVRLETARPRVEVMGTVRPAREVVVRPRVSGEVVESGLEFVPGGRFVAGEMILRIDPADYELAIVQRMSELAEVEAALRLERGNQEIARTEFEILGETIEGSDSDLVLRMPQLRAAEAQVARARAIVRETRLALERTTITAPFDALVLERNVEVGSQVDPTTALVRIAGTDEYWVEALVPVRDFRWIDIPHERGAPGALAQIFDEAAWGPGVSRSGRVIRALGDLEEEGRMARLLVSVTDPLGDDPEMKSLKPPRALLIGSFVRVEIDGTPLVDVAVLDTSLLHDGNRVWVMNDTDELEIRSVTVAFRGRDKVLVSAGLSEGERIIRSDLPVPVEGMSLRLTSVGVGSDG